MYSIDFTKPVREWWEESLITLKLIPRDTLRGRFQDGSSQTTKVNTLYHSTTCENFASICQNGLKTTSHSHEVTGCLFGDCIIECLGDAKVVTLRCFVVWLFAGFVAS